MSDVEPVSRALSRLPDKEQGIIQKFFDKTSRAWWPWVLLDLYRRGKIPLTNSDKRDLESISPLATTATTTTNANVPDEASSNANRSSPYYPPSPYYQPYYPYYTQPSVQPSPSPLPNAQPSPSPSVQLSPSVQPSLSPSVQPSPSPSVQLSPSSTTSIIRKAYDLASGAAKCGTGFRRESRGSTRCVPAAKKKSPGKDNDQRSPASL